MNRETLHTHTDNAPTAQVIEFSELLSPNDHAQASSVLQTHHPLHNIKTQLQVCVGKASVTVGQLLNAKEQQVLVLDRTPEQPVDLLLDGHVVARGHLVAVNGHFAVRITELPVPLALQSKA